MWGYRQKILEKAEKYLQKQQASDPSSVASTTVDNNVEGGYKKYLNKAMEIMHKKDGEKELGEDGKPKISEEDNDKYKKYMTIASGLLVKHMLKRRKKKKRGGQNEEGEGESESEEEEEEENEEEDEEDGWLSKFMEEISSLLED
ncbi:unnamed protein product [Amaranthus hypochondriacus]